MYVPIFGLKIVKEVLLLDKVVAISLATRSVLRSMLTAGVAVLLASGSPEVLCKGQ